MVKKDGKKEKIDLQIKVFIQNVGKLALPTKVVISLVLAIFFILSSFLAYNLYFAGKIYPGIYIAGNYVGGKTPAKAADLLSENIKIPDKIVLTKEGQTYTIPLSSIDFSYNYTKSAENAYLLSRSQDIIKSLVTRALIPFRKEYLPLTIVFDESKLRKDISVIAGQVAVDPLYPYVKLLQNQVVVEKGSPGEDVDQEKLIKAILENLSTSKFTSIEISTKSVDPSLSLDEAILFKIRAELLLGKTLTLSFENDQFEYSNNDIFELLDANNKYNDKNLESLTSEISIKIERVPQNPVFIFQDNIVKEFSPAKNGIKLDKNKFTEEIKGALETLETSDNKTVTINIPTIDTPPDYKTEDVNNLGIKELIGIGKSKYAGSISSRVYNIALASSKFNGILVKPDEVFSFNDTLGDISTYTGYKQAYVIKDGKTVLGDGGGVCQVSTTFFRAILNAGLPIVERRAHSYRVGYYEQGSPPGIDATVYAPTTDLKFKNDTPGHLLIQTRADTKAMTLVFEIYGTSDGRKSQISKPVVTNVTPPPEDLYTDDPTLPAGEIKQIDWKAWGAKVSFNYNVERNSETIYQKTFYSNYQPWQAKYLKGTGPSI